VASASRHPEARDGRKISGFAARFSVTCAKASRSAGAKPRLHHCGVDAWEVLRRAHGRCLRSSVGSQARNRVLGGRDMTCNFGALGPLRGPPSSSSGKTASRLARTDNITPAVGPCMKARARGDHVQSILKRTFTPARAAAANSPTEMADEGGRA